MSTEENASPARRTGPIDRFFVNTATGLNSKEVGYVLKYSVMPGFSLHSLPENMDTAAALEADAEKKAQHGDFDVAHNLQSSTNSLRELIGIQNNVFDACLKLRKVAHDAKESLISLKQYDKAGKWAKVDSAVSQLLTDVDIDRMRPPPPCIIDQEQITSPQNDNQSQIEDGAVRDDGDISVENDFDDESGTEEGLEVAPLAPNMRKRKMRQYQNKSKRVSNGSSKRSRAIGPVTMTKWRRFLQKNPSYTSELLEFTESAGKISAVFCRACAKPVSWTNVRDHCAGQTHKDRVNKRKQQEEQTQRSIDIMSERQRDENLVGSTLHNDTKAARMDFVKSLFVSNVSLQSSLPIKDFCERYGVPNLGDIRTLNDMVTFVHEDLIERIKRIIGSEVGCDYGITIDASPYSFSAEAMTIRTLDVDAWNINETLAGLNLYEKSPNSENTAASLLRFIRRYDLRKEGWICTMMDGASVNTAAVDRLVTQFDAVNVKRIRCLSHFLNLVGQKMMQCPELKKVMKYINQMRQSPKCRQLFRTLYNEECKGNSSIRWYNEYEFVVQIAEHGLQHIMENFVIVANSRSWAKKSSGKLIKYYNENKASMAKVITAAATIRYGGIKFCKACYILEGDSNLIFRVDPILRKLERFTGLEADQFVLPDNNEDLNQAFDASVEIVRNMVEPFHNEIDQAREAIGTNALAVLEASDALNDAMQRLDELQNPTEPTLGGAGRSGGRNTRARRGPLNYNAMHNGRPRQEEVPEIDRLQQEIEELRTKFQDSTRDRDVAQQTLERKQSDFVAFKDERNILSTTEEFKSYGQSLIRPAIKYYIDSVLKDAGSLSDVRKGYSGVKIFDPTFVKGTDMLTLRECVDKLKYLRIKRLDAACLEEMKNELAYLQMETRSANEDMTRVDGVEEYERKLTEKNEKNGTAKTWEGDDSEYGRRIWKWWGSKHSLFHAFDKAVRVVALVQPSSASVERVFSQLKLILEEIGEVGLHDNIEARLMARCCKDNN